jgi:thiosulfate/3-mercaptopyruvate sulfurtransferase
MTVLPIHERGYAHPELLAETDWLAANLANPAIRIIDARPAQQYEAGHIPGAVNLSGFGGIPRAENGDMAAPEQFARIASEFGIGDATEVVIYDAPSQQMGMVAWSFLYYGHPATRMLDGGLTKWTAEGRPISTTAAFYSAAAFHAHPVEEVYCSLETAKATQGQAGTVFWDTRSQAEYDGTASAGFGGPLPRPGHISGAVHLEWTELLDPATRTFKPAEELRALLEAKGITPDVEVHSY